MARKASGKASDRRLGVGLPIDRRDFLQGVAIGVGAGLAPELAAAQTAAAAQDQPGYYPPLLTGMRGSHPGSFEAAHALRDGDFWAKAKGLDDVDGLYDLVIVGGGISGLSAAYFWRRRYPDAKVLILENHDDFGGHAKRNEFNFGGAMQLMNGGTLDIDSPYPYSPVAAGLLKDLGVDPVAFEKADAHPGFFASLGMGSAVQFDQPTFGENRLVRSDKGLDAFLSAAPLSPAVRDSIRHIEAGADDPMPDLDSDAKKDRLSRISYQQYLLEVLKADPGVVTYYRHRTDPLWGCGIDAVSALDGWATGLPGFSRLKLKHGSTARMGYTPAGYSATGGSAFFHFPDGNASIARLLVRRLVPGALSGSTGEDIVTAKADYSQLDRPGSPVRIRLSSTVVRARNTGPAGASDGVELLYGRDGEVYRVRGKACVLASWNMMIPHICPELPQAQKAALHSLIKTPLVYTSVGLANWRAFQALGAWRITAPGGYFSEMGLNEAVDIGDYRSPRSPDEPILLHMMRTPARPGLPERRQHLAGARELLSTSFETFERNIRAQLDETLSPGGFDAARDILAITVNRWPHGYAPEHNSLIDPDVPPDQRPNVIGRQRFGRIAIANADSGLGAYTDVAIDQAHRAVGELSG